MFYPGDVLRDTYFLNEAQKGCYLTILCIHIEHIRISYDLLMIITRHLSDYEKESFVKIFDKDDNGYFLNWVVNSIEKRSNYLTSRSNNKAGRPKKIEDLPIKKPKSKKAKKEEIIQESYDIHMVNENVNENVNKEEDKIEIKKQKIEIEKSELEIVFDEYLEMRKKLGKAATPKAIELAKKKIKEYSKGNVETAIKIIEQSILNSWQGIFELKENKNSYQTKQEDQKAKMNNAFNELANKYLNEL